MKRFIFLAVFTFFLDITKAQTSVEGIDLEKVTWQCNLTKFDYSKNVFPVEQCYLIPPRQYPDSLVTNDNIVLAYRTVFNFETKQVDTLDNLLFSTVSRYTFRFTTPEEKEGDIDLGRGGTFHFVKDDDDMVMVTMTGAGDLKNYTLYILKMGKDKKSQAEIQVKDGTFTYLGRSPKGNAPGKAGETK